MKKIDEDDIEDALESLEQIYEAMRDLDSFFNAVGGITAERWRAYPKGHILMSLGDEHDYIGRGGATIAGLIEEAEESLGEEEDDEDDE